jgi:hypothetical protein
MGIETRRQSSENSVALHAILLKKREFKRSRCIFVEKASPYWRISYLNKIRKEQGMLPCRPNTWDNFNSGKILKDDVINLFNKIPIHSCIRELYTRVLEKKEDIIKTGIRFKNIQLCPMINVIDTYNYFKGCNQYDLIEFGYIDEGRDSELIVKIAYIPSVNRFVLLRDCYLTVSHYSFGFHHSYATGLIKFNELINNIFLMKTKNTSIMITNIKNGAHLIGKKCKYEISNYEL